VENRTTSAPELRIFPATDKTFRASAETVLRDLEMMASDDYPISEGDLVSTLRQLYPNVSVHARDELGEIGQHRVTWYVYRDGRVRPDDWRRDRLYRARAQARAAVADSGNTIERSLRMVTFRQDRYWTRRAEQALRGLLERRDPADSPSPPDAVPPTKQATP
jgi:DNA primase large subunit